MSKQERPALPPGLDLLWGRRQRPRRGPKPGLSIDGIVDAAMGVADAEGLDAVSMARVAKELGFTTMSLYRYVTSKDELLQMMWNASARGVEDLVLEGDTWRERLRMWAMVQRGGLDRHAWLTQMPLAAPPLAPNSMIFVERGLETFDGTGLGDADKLRIIGLITSYALSEARMAHDAARAAAQSQAEAQAAEDRASEDGASEDGAAEGEPAPQWGFEALLRELVDEETYPRLYRIAWSGEIGDNPSGFDEDQEFSFGLDRILDGVAALIERSRSG